MIKPGILQLRIQIDHITPPIWRRLLVASNATLKRLHDIIQVVMGWENSHMYAFVVKGVEYAASGDMEFSQSDRSKPPNPQKARLADLGLSPGKKFKYVYDFGDDWQHSVAVEKVLSASRETKVPICLDGQRACPPEDCGSYPGYDEIHQALGDRKNPQWRELLTWLGDYDPEFFDVGRVNKRLRPRLILAEKQT